MDDCFYVPLDADAARVRATAHTGGPWDARAQHGGPPSALLGRAVERCAPRDDMTVARVTVELLGPVPVGELDVRVRVARPGRSVELLEAALSAGGRDVATARAWRVLRTPDGTPDGTPDAASDGAPDAAVAGGGPGRPALPLLPLPPAAPLPVAEGWLDGYLSAVEWRPVRGSFAEPGPGTAWTRLRHPLVAGEQPTPLQRVLAVADSGNGLSSQLDIARWHFINPELTVHLHREAVGEWVCLDATTTISPGGAGLASSVLSDATGPVGTGAQALLVAPRPVG